MRKNYILTIMVIGVCIFTGLHTITAETVESQTRDSQVTVQDSSKQGPMITSIENASDFPTGTSSPTMSIGVFGGQLFTCEDASHLYTNGLGGGIEISVNSSRFLFLVSGQVYTAKSNNIWTDTYTILSVTGGLGYTAFEYEKNAITVIGRYGVIAHWNGSTWYLNQKGEVGIRLSHQISDYIRPFIDGNVLVMFAEPSNTVLYNWSVGIQYKI